MDVVDLFNFTFCSLSANSFEKKDVVEGCGVLVRGVITSQLLS